MLFVFNKIQEIIILPKSTDIAMQQKQNVKKLKLLHFRYKKVVVKNDYNGCKNIALNTVFALT